MLLPPLALALATGAVRVSGSGTCPSPGDVERQLDGLLPERADWKLAARLEPTPGALELELLDTAGRVVSRRAIPLGRPCAELAEVAALVFTSWLSNLSPAAVPAEPLPAPAALAPAEPIHTPWSWTLALAPAVSLSGAGFAGGGIVEVDGSPPSSRWGGELLAFYDGAQQLADGLGAVSWQRFALGAGGRFALSKPPFRVELTAQAVLSATVLGGRGYWVDQSTVAWDPGLRAGARLLALRGRWHPWLGLWGVWFFDQEVPSVIGLSLNRALPELEAVAGIGIAWTFERF